MIDYHLRPVEREPSGHVSDGESAFIGASWLRSYQSSSATRRLPLPDYYAYHRPVIAGLMRNATVIVAEQEAAAGALLGFACAEVVGDYGVLHYVYVKGNFRKLGVGRKLWNAALEAAGRDEQDVVFSHVREPFAYEIARPRGWRYLPYPAMRWADWRNV